MEDGKGKMEDGIYDGRGKADDGFVGDIMRDTI